MKCSIRSSHLLPLILTALLGLELAATAQQAPSSGLQGALEELRGMQTLPCDTWVALPDSTGSAATILAKNSDRTVFDCQPLLLHPRQSWDAGSTIDLGRVRVPQVPETFATLGSSPYWCWGYEEGVNEHGVAIGNEGLYTRGVSDGIRDARAGAGPPLGPTGMDLLRLTLERSRTAGEAVVVLGALLEEHGQYGSGMPGMPVELGGYDNSYLIADAREAWVMETADRSWVARRQAKGSTSISNVASIGRHWDLASEGLIQDAIGRGWWPEARGAEFDFAAATMNPAPQYAAQAKRAGIRAACSQGLLLERAGKVDPRWMMRIARDRSTEPSLDLDVTASSCVVVLPKGAEAQPVFWWAASVPSNSCYVPFFVESGSLPPLLTRAGGAGRRVVPPSQAPRDTPIEGSYWWRFRELSDLVRVDYATRNPIVREAFDPLELSFEAGLEDLIREARSLRKLGETERANELLRSYSASCVERVLAKLDELRKQLGSMELEVPEALLGYVGLYATKLGGQSVEIEVLVQSSSLAVRLPDGRIFELLEPDHKGRWHFAATDQASVQFQMESDSLASAMTLTQPGVTFELERTSGGK